jgi:hypothetical protein
MLTGEKCAITQCARIEAQSVSLLEIPMHSTTILTDELRYASRVPEQNVCKSLPSRSCLSKQIIPISQSLLAISSKNAYNISSFEYQLISFEVCLCVLPTLALLSTASIAFTVTQVVGIGM